MELLSSATKEQIIVLVDRILPAELQSRGVGEDLKVPLRDALRTVSDEAVRADTPEAVFQRLGG